MTPEGRILAKLTKWLQAQHLSFIRLALQPSVKRGWPDLCILLPGGAPLFVELKRPGAQPSPAQTLRIAELRDAGYFVAVFHSFDEAVGTVLATLDARGLSA